MAASAQAARETDGAPLGRGIERTRPRHASLTAEAAVQDECRDTRMRWSLLSALKHAGLIVMGLILGLSALEVGLRLTAWGFVYMRRPPSLASAKAGGTIRVLCLGESTTADMEFLGKESYPAQLEKILNESATGTAFSVVNGGVPATTTDVILDKLPENLERYKPDIVVTMMGINDGEWTDPAFQVSGGLRVWRLAKTLYHTIWNPQAPMLIAGAKTWPSIENAASFVIEGHNAEAAEALAPLLDQNDWQTLKMRALGLNAILNWQIGNVADAERSHDAFLERDREIAKAKTIRNYRRLQSILRERNIPLVAVQYPVLPVDMLREMLEPDPSVVLVDNEKIFLDQLRTHHASNVFRDLFAGIFGHLTPYANGLLAQAVATAVLQVVDGHGAGHAQAHRVDRTF